MAEKTKTKKLASKKEAHEEPVADLADEVIKKTGDAEITKEELEREEDESLEFGKDEYAENPEDVLDEVELKELEEVKKETEKRVNGNGRGRKKGLSVAEVLNAWEPRTKLGNEVKSGKIKNIDEILGAKKKILEPEIVDSLINVNSELISIGQSKGKFGGGKRRAWRQTQRKTKEGNVPSFSTLAVVGDENGHVGIGTGKAKETLPARDKAIRKAKLNIIKVTRTCAGFDCSCSELHSVPFKVTGKAGSVRVTLIPASQGTGLVVGSELKKILKLAGIKDVYSRTTGKKRTTFNLVKACIDALEQTNRMEGMKK